MSSMLEQAIVDAAALREAALKNAEQSIIEKYAPQIKDALEMYETRLKAVSFLKYEETGYVQAPYEPITKKQYEKLIKNIQPIQRFDTDEGGSGTKFCTNDSCTIWGRNV